MEDVYSKGGVCSPRNIEGEPSTRVGTHRKVIESVIKAKIMGLSTPGSQSSGLEHYISI